MGKTKFKSLGLSLKKWQKLAQGGHISGTKKERDISKAYDAWRGLQKPKLSTAVSGTLPMPFGNTYTPIAPGNGSPFSFYGPADVDAKLGVIGASQAKGATYAGQTPSQTPPPPVAPQLNAIGKGWAGSGGGSGSPLFAGSVATPAQAPKLGTNVKETFPGSGQFTGIKLPVKVGGYTDAEMEKAFAGVNDIGRTGYDWGKGNGLPGAAGATSNKGYAGFYQTPNGMWHVLDQKKIDDYNAGKGGKGGGGGGGGGGDNAGGKAGSYSVEGAPNWWSGILLPGNTPEQQYANNLNAAIPFMSPEDQRAASQYLADNFAEFAAYKNIAYEAPPAQITTGIREAFWSRDRANQYLNTLTQIMQAMGKTPEQMGAGFVFLQNVGDILSQFGGGAMGTNNLQTREQYQQMLTALDPVLQQAGAEGSATAGYVPIANYLYNPTFSAGPLMSIAKNPDGTYSFGAPNQQLF